ncbi:MAG TPA: FMN-binding negative transcriptional regulator [Chitinophagaceae bacterium]
MYPPPYYKEKDRAVLIAFMREHPFVIVSGSDGDNKPVATHIPLLPEEKDGKLFLYGHVQRRTDHQLAFEQNPRVLAIFTGPHAYISASWYTNPQMASTWNYMTVHASGTLRFLDDAALLDLLAKTTNHFEQTPQSPALVEKMPEEYVSRMMKAIVAFEIEVTALDNVFKLSQNRDRASYGQIIARLEEQGGEATLVAAEMEKRRLQLFKE